MLIKKIFMLINKMNNINVMIATPCYGGNLTTGYFESILHLQQKLIELKIKHKIITITNESLIPRARNSLVARFLGNQEYTHLFFIDADIVFSPETFIRCLLFNQDTVSGAAYPKKSIDYQKVIDTYKETNASVQECVSKSMGYAFNLFPNINRYPIRNGFMKVKYLATGFLCVHRSVIMKMIEKYPEQKYKNDIPFYELETSPDNFWLFFDCMVDPDTKRYLSEDYAFCKKWEDIGGEIWMDIISPLTHIGTYHFSGNVGYSLDIHKLLEQTTKSENVETKSENVKTKSENVETKSENVETLTKKITIDDILSLNTNLEPILTPVFDELLTKCLQMNILNVEGFGTIKKCLDYIHSTNRNEDGNKIVTNILTNFCNLLVNNNIINGNSKMMVENEIMMIRRLL
jgi:hypothetical protein